MCIYTHIDSHYRPLFENIDDHGYICLFRRFFSEARARILGKPDLYIKTGSSLTLTCLMSQGPHDLGTVDWYRDNQPLDTSTISENDVDTAPRITVETEWSEALTSRYTASPSHVQKNSYNPIHARWFIAAPLFITFSYKRLLLRETTNRKINLKK